MGKGKKKFVFVVVAILLILLSLCYLCYVSIEETKKSHEEQLSTRCFMTEEEALKHIIVDPVWTPSQKDEKAKSVVE